MIQKLIEAISIQIDQIFNNAIIYTNHVKQDFKDNSFFIRIVKNSEKSYIASRYKLFNRVEIIYTPKFSNNLTLDINNVKAKLFKEMRILKFDGGRIIGNNMECEIKDNNLLFYIDYDFYIFRFNETIKMNKLFSNGGTK